MADEECFMSPDPELNSSIQIVPQKLFVSNGYGVAFELKDTSNGKEKCIVQDKVLTGQSSSCSGNRKVTTYCSVPTELLMNSIEITDGLKTNTYSQKNELFQNINKYENEMKQLYGTDAKSNYHVEKSESLFPDCTELIDSGINDMKEMSDQTDNVSHDLCVAKEEPLNDTSDSVRRDSLGRAIVHFCRICKKKFNNRHQVDSHVLVKHTLDQKYKCDQCSLTFPFRRLLLSHVKSTHKKTASVNYSDDRIVWIYPEEFGKPAKEEHVIAWRVREGITYSPLVECCFCRKKIHTCGIQMHFKHCHSTWHLRYVCSFCGTEFKALKSLARHTEKEKPCTKLYCVKCDLNMGTMESFRRHNSIVHPIETAIKESLKCNNCGKVFTQRYYLQNHLKHCNVSKKLAHDCGLCARSFVTLRGLQTHVLKSHSENSTKRVKPFICIACDMSFATRNDKERHVSQCHRDFKCDICHKTFINESKLKRHKVLHRTEKTFSCPICDTANRYRSDICVRKHMRRCHPEKFVEYYGWDVKIVKFVCEICEKSCPTRGDLAKHMRKHTNERPFSCEHCESAFKQRRHRKEHMMYKHKDIYETQFGPIIYKHTCNKCEAKFLASSSLKKHLKSHIRQEMLEHLKDKKVSPKCSQKRNCSEKELRKKRNAQEKNLNAVINRLFAQNAAAKPKSHEEEKDILNKPIPKLSNVVYESVRYAPAVNQTYSLIPSSTAINSFQCENFHVAVQNGQVMVEDTRLREAAVKDHSNETNGVFTDTIYMETMRIKKE